MILVARSRVLSNGFVLFWLVGCALVAYGFDGIEWLSILSYALGLVVALCLWPLALFHGTLAQS